MFSVSLVSDSEAVIVSVRPGGGIDHSSVHPQRAPMLDQVGRLGRQRSGSAVYLGNGWILTANHAFEGRQNDLVVFAEKEYRMLPKRAVHLKNPPGSGLATATDLVMVLLESAPDLPALKVIAQTPFAGEPVVMVGYGEASAAGGEPVILTESHNLPVPLIHPISADADPGRDVAAGLHWGENEIAGRGITVGVRGGVGQTSAFATICQPGSTERNAQGAKGDSGGGVFVKRGERWDLAGVMLSVIQRKDIDASGTFIADLSAYRQQIEATIPEPSALSLLLVAAGLGLRRRR